MKAIFSDMWRSLLESLATFGRMTLFLLQLLAATPAAMLRPRLIVHQLYNAGALSLLIVMTCAVFVGMVLGLLGYDLLTRVASEEILGAGAALTLTKQLGPVLAALLFAGRAGSALASELGLMRATDQLAAMQMMAVDPMRRVALPRFLGGILAMPLLTAIFIAIAIFGVQLVGVQQMKIDPGSFWSQMQSAVELADIYEGVIKSAVFGVACSLIAVYEGFTAIPTAEGIGRATTRTVVISSVATLILNFILTAFFL